MSFCFFKKIKALFFCKNPKNILFKIIFLYERYVILVGYTINITNLISIVIITLLLKYNSYFDTKYNSVEPVSLLLATVILTLINIMRYKVYGYLFWDVITNAFIGLIIGFSVFLIMKIFLQGGSGDLLLMSCFGWWIGSSVVTIIIIYFIIRIFLIVYIYNDIKDLYYIQNDSTYRLNKNKLNIKCIREAYASIPFVPILMVSWIVTLIIYTFKNIFSNLK